MSNSPVKSPNLIHHRLVISGNYLEHYHYGNALAIGFCFPREKASLKIKFLPQKLMRDDNVRRTRQKIRRFVNSNTDMQKFMTLTFGSSVKSLTEANPVFHNFIKRLSRLYPDLKYLCVPEFQPTSGRVHYHLLTNLPFIENSFLTSLWGQGFTFIRKIDSVSNLGAYICKYLGKANFDSRYFGKRKFFYSFNLLRSVVVDNLDDVLFILKNLPLDFPELAKKMFDFEVFTKYLGLVKYSQYWSAELIKVDSA